MIDALFSVTLGWLHLVELNRLRGGWCSATVCIFRSRSVMVDRSCGRAAAEAQAQVVLCQARRCSSALASHQLPHATAFSAHHPWLEIPEHRALNTAVQSNRFYPPWLRMADQNLFVRPRAGPHTSGELLFDHVKFGVSDYAASKAFFLKALEPLGVAVVSEGPPTYGVELSPKGKASLCLYQTEEKPAHLHLAFTAENRQQVEAFYRAALEAGGKDNGAPGQ